MAANTFEPAPISAGWAVVSGLVIVVSSGLS